MRNGDHISTSTDAVLTSLQAQTHCLHFYKHMRSAHIEACFLWLYKAMLTLKSLTSVAS